MYPKWEKITTSDRKLIKQKCGNKCFLLPTNLKFPVCNTNCKYNCNGLLAAKIRGYQWNYPDVVEKSKKLMKKNKCSWKSKSSSRTKSKSRRGSGRPRKSSSKKSKSRHNDD